MPSEPKKQNRTILIAGIAGLVVIIGAVAVLTLREKQPPAPVSGPVAAQPEKVRVPVKNQPLIDFKDVQEKEPAKDLMADRKAKYGLEEGVDIIATSDETVKIGDTTISIKEIEDQIRLDGGNILEKDLETGASGGKVNVFGLYVVQPGDNIWNIHFNFLKDYFGNKGISVSRLADEPDGRGFSSGVGKLLKFSENIVYIYNIKEQKLDTDLHLIYPLSKVVVYNMTQVFALLDSIDPDQVAAISFDGENLWVKTVK